MRLPVLRKPTEEEQKTFDKTGRWPDSYVDARLDHSAALSAALDRMDPLVALEALSKNDLWSGE